MKIKVTILFLLVFICNYMVAQDNNIDRVVTVEREFQPDVHQAYKIQLTPNFQNEEMEANPEVDSTYSTYSNTLSVDYNLHPLKAAKTDFTPQSTLMDVRFEGALCTSPEDPDYPMGSTEGYEGKDEFAGWGF